MHISKTFVVLLAMTAACGDETVFENSQSLVAAVDNASILMGVQIADDATLTGYVCGDEARFQTFSRWYSGTLEAQESFRLENDGWVLAGRIENDAQVIDLETPDGATFTGALTLVGADQTGGVFENNDFGCRSGAIALPADDGSVRVQGALCSQPGIFANQITPVRVLENAAERFEAEAVGIDGAPFFMNRVR